MGLAATDDDLWVSDWATSRCIRIMADGELLAEPKPVATDLSAPKEVAVAPDGSLLVVETGVGHLSSIDLETGEVSTVTEGLLRGAEGYLPSWIFNGVAVLAFGIIRAVCSTICMKLSDGILSGGLDSSPDRAAAHGCNAIAEPFRRQQGSLPKRW